MKHPYRKTLTACFIGYIVQAVVNNFVPLLFVTFQTSYQIPLSRITLLITVNFLVQLLVDSLSAGLIDRIGYRASALMAHGCAAVGLWLLTVLPDRMPDPFSGILISVVLYAVGGGLLEVLVSPIVEACPSDNKEKAMSLLHSFYCWGHVGVVLLSTLFFAACGTEHWKLLARLWTLIPLGNMVLFARVPLYRLQEEGEAGLSLRALCSRRLFWVLMLMMLCAGASEQAVSQWASAFAEQGLGVSKTVGDLAGPMAFALLMGTSRLIYGKYGDRLPLERCMVGSCLLCIASYAAIACIPSPVGGLIGCAVCGFSVGILWPGTFSRAASSLRGGGTVLFALLALAGDLGCSGGPALAGWVSDRSGGNLRLGILSAVVFPFLLLLCLLLPARSKRRETR